MKGVALSRKLGKKTSGMDVNQNIVDDGDSSSKQLQQQHDGDSSSSEESDWEEVEGLSHCFSLYFLNLVFYHIDLLLVVTKKNANLAVASCLPNLSIYDLIFFVHFTWMLSDLNLT